VTTQYATEHVLRTEARRTGCSANDPGAGRRGCLHLAIAACLLCGATAGCGNSQPYVSEARLQRGLVLVFPGIEGRSPFNEAICRGLSDGGVNCAIELYDWTSSLGPLYNLRAESRNRRMAGRIADRIVAYNDNYPGRPVVLVGQSGGGAIAIWVAEQLTWGGKLDGVILIAPAISARYDLRRAAANAKRGVVTFHSPHDWILLGTAIAGTMDGEHTTAAGRSGFEVPIATGSETAPAAYARVFQVPWERSMAKCGHIGGHLSSGASDFIAAYVAPLVRTPQWSRPAIAEILRRQMTPATSQPTSVTGPERTPVWRPTTAPAEADQPASAPNSQGSP